MENLLDTLYRWNKWGSAELAFGFERDITSTILKCIDIPEVVTLVGPRRAGKTTILYQIINEIEKLHGAQSILHVNLEEPAIASKLSNNLLDEIYDTYRTHVNPSSKAYIFLDEVQNVPEWERWVRARNESENIKVFVTGSSAQLMSRELGTLLTGRHITFEVYQLSFKEFLRFKGVEVPVKPYPNNPDSKIKNALISYFKWGGFPRVVLAEQDDLREKLLRRYFDDMLFKDIVLRHQVRHASFLRTLASHLMTQTGSLVSYKRLANIFNVSTDLIKNYCEFLVEGFFIDLLPFYNLKTAERNRKPFKVHAIDSGMRNEICLSHSLDYGYVMESMVSKHLKHREDIEQVFYWNGMGEVDFLTIKGAIVNNIIQVVYSNLDDPNVINREVSSIKEALRNFSNAQASIVAWDMPSNMPEYDNINVIPLWKFMLDIT